MSKCGSDDLGALASVKPRGSRSKTENFCESLACGSGAEESLSTSEVELKVEATRNAR
jgi:hypothetical protein